MTVRKPKQFGVRAIFAIPLAISIFSIVGLVAALTGDGWHDALSWLALGVPIVAVGWAVKFQRN